MDRKKYGLVLAAAAGAACTVGAAFADEVDQVSSRTPGKVLIDKGDSFLSHRVQDAFGDRAINVIVYDGASAAFVNQAGSLANCSHILEDISLANGPYGPSYVGTRTISGMEYSYGLTASAATWDMRFSFYSPSQADFGGLPALGSMIASDATPYYTLTVTGFDTNICPGFTTRTGFFLLPSTVEMPASESSLWLEGAFVEPGTPGTAPLTTTNLFQVNKVATNTYWFFGNNTAAKISQPGHVIGASPVNILVSDLAFAGNPAAPGYSNPAYGRDSNFDGIFTGQSLAHSSVPASGVNELRFINNNTATVQTGQTLSYVFGLVGQIDSPPFPGGATNLNDGGGFLGDGVQQMPGTLSTAAQYRWYSFNTKYEISYAQTTFLDIDTEGSDQPTSFAVYTPDSAVFDVAESRGDGPDPVHPSANGDDNFQISYGVARRAGVGAGDQYSGQEGILPAGQYYIAVALNGAGFGDGWSVAGVDPGATVNFSLNINGNNQKTIPAGPAVSPALLTGTDAGVLSGTAITTPSISVPARVAQFVRFSLTNNLPTTNQFNQSDGSELSDVTYMDITQPGSSVVGEWNFCLYNNNGFLANASSISYAGAGFNDNNGGGDGPWGCGGSFAQLSYGTAASRGQTPLDPSQTTLGLPLNNQNGGSLSADQYYLAVTMGTAFFANERWGARSTRGSSLTAVITLDSNNRGPSGGCPSDFNGDGGVDDNDFVFFAKYYNDLTNIAGDLNFDTLTDDSDFVMFSQAYDTLVCF